MEETFPLSLNQAEWTRPPLHSDASEMPTLTPPQHDDDASPFQRSKDSRTMPTPAQTHPSHRMYWLLCGGFALCCFLTVPFLVVFTSFLMDPSQVHHPPASQDRAGDQDTSSGQEKQKKRTHKTNTSTSVDTSTTSPTSTTTLPFPTVPTFPNLGGGCAERDCTCVEGYVGELNNCDCDEGFYQDGEITYSQSPSGYPTGGCTGILCNESGPIYTGTAGDCVCASGYAGEVTYEGSTISGGCEGKDATHTAAEHGEAWA